MAPKQEEPAQDQAAGEGDADREADVMREIEQLIGWRPAAPPKPAQPKDGSDATPPGQGRRGEGA